MGLGDANLFSHIYLSTYVLFTKAFFLNTKVNFSNIKQCGQVWDTMEACDGGRQCSKCDHVIHDFRGMLAWDIALVHAKSESKVCGLYDKSILEEPTIKSSISSRVESKVLLPSLFGMLLANSSLTAQQERVQLEDRVEIVDQQPIDVVSEDNQSIKKEPGQAAVIDSLDVLRGLLLDEYGEPIVGGAIIIEDSDIGTISDIDGTFILDVTEHLSEENEVSIIASSLGYGRLMITVHKDQLQNDLDLTLITMVLNHNQAMTSFGIKRTSFPKRLWRSVTSVFRKKPQPH